MNPRKPRHVPYVGNGPYCYANSFAVLLGERAPSTAVIEVATGGAQPPRRGGRDRPGFPYAEVPIEDFMNAWRAETIAYGEPHTMRTGFRKVADVAARTRSDPSSRKRSTGCPCVPTSTCHPAAWATARPPNGSPS